MLVLENLTYRFKRPNVLDIKLGTQLFDEDASPEKQERMTKAAAATTSKETGVRLTGFQVSPRTLRLDLKSAKFGGADLPHHSQVWDSATQSFVTTPKAFGKTIAVEELPHGISRFFYPPLSESLPFELADSASSFSSSADLSTVTRPEPLPKDLLIPILSAIILRLKQKEQMLSSLELRVRGSSLLIVVEGDATALAAAIDRVQEEASKPSTRDGAEEEEDDSDAESVSTTDGEGNAKPHTLLPFDVKWIDFAHARAAPGEGIDEGLILGVKTTRELLEGLREKLKAGEETN
jgi:inositol-polyphosphate multikinase